LYTPRTEREVSLQQWKREVLPLALREKGLTISTAQEVLLLTLQEVSLLAQLKAFALQEVVLIALQEVMVIAL